jgi:hypothetical protein
MRELRDDEVAAWVEHTLLAPDRKLPIVAITSHPGTNRGWIDPAELQAQLGDAAEVVFLGTGDATWALSEALPPRLEVYGGALRVWWPGLTRQSNPYDHRLYLVLHAADAERVRRDIVQAIEARGHGATAAVVAAPAADDLQPTTARVTGLSTTEAVLTAGARRGPLLEADLPLPMLLAALEIGCELRARPLRPLGDGRWSFSVRGLLPDPWQRFAAEVKVGDIVTGRVQALREEKQIAFVDVLPGVVGICHIRELDYSFAPSLGEYLQPGELHPFAVLSFDAGERMLHLSRKRAYGDTPRELPSLVAGGRPFVWTPGMPWFSNLRQQQQRGAPIAVRPFTTPLAQTAPRDPSQAEQIDALTEELQAANTDRQSLRDEIRRLRGQVTEAKKDRRSLDDRLQAMQQAAAEGNVLASERAFLKGVRVQHARLFDEDDRLAHPLLRMRVGREFLTSVAATPGVDVDKLVEICAQVAADIAHSVPGRDVHALRDGSRGAGDRLRKRDGARAWRCALHQGPSAPRLHWWNVPGPHGATIEFANVGLHDGFDIAEG